MPCFRHWCKVIAMQGLKLRDLGHEGIQVTSHGPALQGQHWAKRRSAKPAQAITCEFKNSRWIFESRLFLQVQVAFIRHFNAYENLHPLCVTFLKLVDWPYATVLQAVNVTVSSVRSDRVTLCTRWMIRVGNCHIKWEGSTRQASCAAEIHFSTESYSKWQPKWEQRWWLVGPCLFGDGCMHDWAWMAWLWVGVTPLKGTERAELR